MVTEPGGREGRGGGRWQGVREGGRERLGEKLFQTVLGGGAGTQLVARGTRKCKIHNF